MVHLSSSSSKSCRFILNWGFVANVSIFSRHPPAEIPFIQDPWKVSSFYANCKILIWNDTELILIEKEHTKLCITLDRIHPKIPESNYRWRSLQNASGNLEQTWKIHHHILSLCHVLSFHLQTRPLILLKNQTMAPSILLNCPKDYEFESAWHHCPIEQLWW